MGKNLSRRNFVAAAAAGLSVMGGAALVGCGQEAGTQGKSQWFLPEKWDYEADVVVVGVGCAGMAAAMEASDLGSSVLAIDGQSEEIAGGSSRISGGYLEDMSYDFFISTGEVHSDEWLNSLMDERRAAINWLIESGLEVTTISETMQLAKGGGPAIFEVAKDVFDNASVEVLYETLGTDLIQNPETEEIVGVYATQGGAQVALKANKGVVLATGSFVANEEFLNEYCYPEAKLYNLTAPYLDGGGHIMAYSVGAKAWRSSATTDLEFYSMCASKASDEVGSGITVMIPSAAPSAIYLNKNGERFTNEQRSITHFKGVPDVMKYEGAYDVGFNGADGYVNLPCYLVFDQKCFDGGSVGNTYGTCTWANLEEGGYLWSEDNQAELEKGWITKADSIEELASLLEIDPQAAAASITSFNEACLAGIDPLGREVTAEDAIGEGPYYGLKIDPGVVYSIAGPKFNENNQVVDWKENVIPRLYVAGDLSQGQVFYPIAIPGVIAYGKRAAQHVATLDSWDA